MLKRLNLGCGPEIKKGFINYDIQPFADICGNCEQGLPFKDSVFDNVLASHILEHVHDLQALKKELLRVMEPGGELMVIVPEYLSPDAWGDDTHCRAFSNQSFFGDFWPGFQIISLKSQKMMKTAINQEVTWLIAHIRKRVNEIL
jgi:predicted SAM-dependent methyltransferase